MFEIIQGGLGMKVVQLNRDEIAGIVNIVSAKGGLKFGMSDIRLLQNIVDDFQAHVGKEPSIEGLEKEEAGKLMTEHYTSKVNIELQDQVYNWIQARLKSFPDYNAEEKIRKVLVGIFDMFEVK